MAGADHVTHGAYASVANFLQIPLVNWRLPSQNELNQFEISMQLPLHKVLGDYLIAKNWYTIVYMYYGDDDLLNLARLTEYFYKKRRVLLTFHLMELPRKDADYDQFFEKFHEKKSNSPETQVIVDVHNSTKMALISKVLKRQKLLKPDRKREFKKYHYVLGFFMSKNDLAMESLKGNATNFINITVLQLFSPTNEVYEQLLSSLSTDEAIKKNFSDLNDIITPEAAFAYDGLLVINTALAGQKFKKSGISNNDLAEDIFPKSMFRKEKMYNGGYRGVYCIPSDDVLHPERPFLPLVNGKKIAARLRDVQFRGLTGDIEFDDNGFRKNFYVNLIELEYMGIPGTSGAVSSITNFVWKDQIGLLTSKARVSYERTRAKVMRSFNRKLNITTALGRPFVMLKENHEKLPPKDKYEGYAMDLINLLSKKIENFDYDIVLSPDGKFGSEKKDGTWDGMIGELMAGRADMAVASLTITRARQQVVDFSKPFLSTGLSIMIRKPAASEFTIFSFMHPLSNEVWMYIIFAYIGISVVLFLVSRFSPYEWRVEEACQGTFTISNDFSVYNCLWFTLSAFMQQGIDILPRFSHLQG
uniref:Uncharacterized protein n=1 Tax=Romanomermis culicivorax TaxID=13658 RepID=A0A915I5V9_ROMCU